MWWRRKQRRGRAARLGGDVRGRDYWVSSAVVALRGAPWRSARFVVDAARRGPGAPWGVSSGWRLGACVRRPLAPGPGVSVVVDGAGGPVERDGFAPDGPTRETRRRCRRGGPVRRDLIAPNRPTLLTRRTPGDMERSVNASTSLDKRTFSIYRDVRSIDQPKGAPNDWCHVCSATRALPSQAASRRRPRVLPRVPRHDGRRTRTRPGGGPGFGRGGLAVRAVRAVARTIAAAVAAGVRGAVTSAPRSSCCSPRSPATATA